MFNDNRPPRLRSYKVYKRTVGGQVFYLGIVSSDNKHTADTRARYLFGKLLLDGEAVWTEDDDNERIVA